ncbi:MAG: hypothetical protein ACE5F1_03865 [Planctomycetota bacterium]
MEVQEAVARISEIHAQLIKSEVFRGYRSWPMGATGALAVLAAALQTTIWPPASRTDFAVFWLLVAGVAGLVCCGDLAHGYLRATSASARRRTRYALGQFAPALVAGVVTTACLLESAPDLLPGLWCLFFALGLFSSRLHLPRQVGWVALWYLVAGTVLLWNLSGVPSPWGMGFSFGGGQLALAFVFLTRIERQEHGCSR